MPLVEQELLFTLLEHPSSTPSFSGVRVTRSVVLWIVVCPYSFEHCVVCPSSIYLLLLPTWYPTLHIFPVSGKSHFPIFIYLHPFYIFLTYCWICSSSAYIYIAWNIFPVKQQTINQLQCTIFQRCSCSWLVLVYAV